MQPDNLENQANEEQPDYSNRITITTLAELEERDRELTRGMTYTERMEYLQKLISITHSEDELKDIEKMFIEGRIYIYKPS